MINKAMLIGNATSDCEKRYTQGGTSVSTFTVACTERYKDKDGNKQEATEFLRCVAWGALADICGDFIKKGTRVYCEGKNTIRKWQDKEGSDRFSHEIVLREMKMLSTKAESGALSQGQQAQVDDAQRTFGTGESVPF